MVLRGTVTQGEIGPKTLTVEFPVRTDEVDRDGRMQLAALVLYLQEAAARHAADLGVSMQQLAEQGLAWVLARFRIRIVRLPTWRETVAVETWPSAIERIYAMRDYLVRDADGRELARADSAWLMMRIDSRRPVRLPRDFGQRVPAGILRSFEDSILNPLELGDDLPIQNSSFEVREADTDINGHVNHAALIGWMIDSALDRLDSSTGLRELVVHFREEAVPGDQVRVDCRPGAAGSNGRSVDHIIRKQGSAGPVLLGRSHWE